MTLPGWTICVGDLAGPVWNKLLTKEMFGCHNNRSATAAGPSVSVNFGLPRTPLTPSHCSHPITYFGSA